MKTPPAPRPPRLLRTTFALAVFSAVLTTLLTAYMIGRDLFSASLEVSLPVKSVWERVNPTLKLEGTTAKVDGGGFDHATLDFTGLGLSSRAWLASGDLLEGLTVVVIAVTVALLCYRVANGKPFTASLPKAITLSGLVILVGGMLWQVCFQIGQLLVAQQAFGPASAQWNNSVSGIRPGSTFWPQPSGNFHLDFWPIGAGLALFAVAVAFRYGEKLERDRAAMATELKGLV
jgi:hypothetical protein